MPVLRTIEARLSSLMASKLCHDLVGPLAALHNGIELMRDGDAKLREEALPLIDMSAQEALARLGFFRLAFGAMGSGEGDAPLADARKAAMNYFREGRVDLQWIEPSGIFWPKAQVKLLLNLIFIASGCLPRGGALRIILLPTPHLFKIEAIGLNAVMLPAIAEALQQDAADLNAETCVAHYVRLLAQSGGCDLGIEPDDGRVNFNVRRHL